MQYQGQETTPEPLRNASTASLPTSAGVRKRTRSSVDALKCKNKDTKILGSHLIGWLTPIADIRNFLTQKIDEFFSCIGQMWQYR